MALQKNVRSDPEPPRRRSKHMCDYTEGAVRSSSSNSSDCLRQKSAKVPKWRRSIVVNDSLVHQKWFWRVFPGKNEGIFPGKPQMNNTLILLINPDSVWLYIWQPLACQDRWLYFAMTIDINKAMHAKWITSSICCMASWRKVCCIRLGFSRGLYTIHGLNVDPSLDENHSSLCPYFPNIVRVNHHIS